MVRMAAFKSYSKVMAVSFLFLRHCERSEAIHERQARLDCFVASAPRKKVAQKRWYTTKLRPQTFIQGGSVPYPPVPTRNDESSSIDRHAKPERVLHDPQTHLAAKRHQRFRVELHAADRQGLVLDRHRDAVLGARGHIEHIGHAVALDIERMVTADHNLIGQVLHQPPAPHLNSRRPPMRGLAELAELPTEIFADRLHPEAAP